MFERYTEKARRVIFFARYEASQLGASSINAEHILLGILRDDKPLTEALFRAPALTVEAVRRQSIAYSGQRDRLPASVDMPLSPDARRVLEFAAAESQNLRHNFIGTEHLLLGLINEGQSLAAKVLAEHGITAERIRAYLDTSSDLYRQLPETGRGESGTCGPGGGIGSITGSVGTGRDRVNFSFSSFEEFARAIASQGGLTELSERFDRLLDLLAQKGVMTDDEKDELKRRRE